MSLRILIVEDDELSRAGLKAKLSEYGIVDEAADEIAAARFLRHQNYDLGVFDLDLKEKLAGLALVRMANQKSIYSIIISGNGDNAILKAGFEAGAKDYLLKPYDKAGLNLMLGRFLNDRPGFDFKSFIKKYFVTNDPDTLDTLSIIKNINLTNRPVFIAGESGTGKRLVTQAIKDYLKIPEQKFIEVNCGQFDDNLICSELFGHVKGAFTGADKDKVGKLALADGGIIFLDEVHTLSLKAQYALLKAIEEKSFYPVGGNRKITSNFRIICATCEDIHELLALQRFRNDLFARISTFFIRLTPLRERKEDIPLIFDRVIKEKKVSIVIEDSAMEILKSYAFPRNVREIEDMIENWTLDGTRIVKNSDLHFLDLNYSDQGKLFKVTPQVVEFIGNYGIRALLKEIQKEVFAYYMKQGISARTVSKIVGVSHTNVSTAIKRETTNNSKLFGRGHELQPTSP